MGREKLFGTDGIRDHILAPVLTQKSVYRLGQVLGQLAKNHAHKTPKVTIGKDTRASCAAIEEALCAGIIAMGVDCHSLGVLPTAAMAHYAKHHQSHFGLMISASHNPYHDNGIKIFDHEGHKIHDAIEQQIEHHYFFAHSFSEAQTKGKIIVIDDATKEYCSMMDSAFSQRTYLNDLRIVVDCAHGAAFKLAPQILSKLSPNVMVMNCEPNGLNINSNAGSEAPKNLIAHVKAQRADIGIAFDGDADRALFVDDEGEIIEGDAVLALLAIAIKDAGRLKKNTMVATVMSSNALDKALAPFDILVTRTHVGDKLVAQKMRADDLCFGGENSGHMLFFPETTTGDGLFSALQFLYLLKKSGVKASKLKQMYTPSPRLLKNIDVPQKIELTHLPKTKAAIDQANEHLKDAGRVMFRYSGTENKARILIEAENMAACHRIGQEISHLYTLELQAAMKLLVRGDGMDIASINNSVIDS